MNTRGKWTITFTVPTAYGWKKIMDRLSADQHADAIKRIAMNSQMCLNFFNNSFTKVTNNG